MSSRKHNETTPLKSFLLKEILPGLQTPLFKDLLDFINFATKIPGTNWLDKLPKNLQPLVSNQMKKRGGDGKGRTQLIKNHYNNYKLIVISRLKQLGVSSEDEEKFINLFNVAFREHEAGQLAIGSIGDLRKILITIEDMDKVMICLKANGGKATLDEIFSWIKNIQD